MGSKEITIALTEKCNLNCVYCYEKHKSTKSMTRERLFEILQKEVTGLEGDVVFNLFGGEPFMEFDLIRDAYKFLSDLNLDFKWEISIITNGTLVHGEVQKWLKKHKKNIICTLSIDGMKEVHNRNRSNSYDDIDLDFFVETFEKPYAKMTISKYTLPNLAENVIFLQNKGFLVNCSLGFGYKWNDYMFSCFDKELARYYESAFANDFDNDTCSLLNFPYKEIYSSQGIYYKNCSAGGSSGAYDTEGNKYPCHMFLPSGFDESEISRIRAISFPKDIVPEENVAERCVECPIFSVCQSCYANNYKMNGNIYFQDEDICLASKILFKHKMNYYSLLWGSGKLSLPETDEYMLLDSILRINKMELT